MLKHHKKQAAQRNTGKKGKVYQIREEKLIMF
jgi:hypothetical protein